MKKSCLTLKTALVPPKEILDKIEVFPNNLTTP